MNRFSRERNEGTMILTAESLLSRAVVSIWSMRHQFERYYSDIREIVAKAATDSYTAIAVHANHGVVAAASLRAAPAGGALPGAAPHGAPPSRAAPAGHPSGVLVVGRHDHAPLQLAEDPTIALRHLALRARRGPSRPELLVLDLNTGQGFEIEGAGRFEGAEIAGPAFLKLGAYAVMLFPCGEVSEIWPATPEGMFDALLQSRVVEKKDRDLHDAIVCFSRGSANSAGRRETLITRVEPPIVPRHRCRPAALPPNTFAVLTVDQQHEESVFPLTAAHLERGVLLGRYGRCEVELAGLRANDMASRVHLLLLKEHNTVLAIDTASSNGTFINGQLATTTTLPDHAVIELAPGNVVHWTTAPRPGDGSAPEPGPRGPASRAEPESDKLAPPSAQPHSRPELALALAVLPPALPPARPRLEQGYIRLARSLARLREAARALNRHRALVLCGIILGLIVGLVIWDSFIPRGDPSEAPTPRQCINPMRDFGTDSPALRLYLYSQDPDVCFESKWSPKGEGQSGGENPAQ